MSKRTLYVGIDPILLTKTAKPPVTEEDNDRFEKDEIRREVLMMIFGIKNMEQYMRVIDIANYVNDHEAVRRDGFIQHLAEELGVGEGQSSRRWKLLVTHFKAFAASLAAFAA
jgi:hypothetical protein